MLPLYILCSGQYEPELLLVIFFFFLSNNCVEVQDRPAFHGIPLSSVYSQGQIPGTLFSFRHLCLLDELPPRQSCNQETGWC